jgi:hypothetical protein
MPPVSNPVDRERTAPEFEAPAARLRSPGMRPPFWWRLTPSRLHRGWPGQDWRPYASRTITVKIPAAHGSSNASISSTGVLMHMHVHLVTSVRARQMESPRGCCEDPMETSSNGFSIASVMSSGANSVIGHDAGCRRGGSASRRGLLAGAVSIGGRSGRLGAGQGVGSVPGNVGRPRNAGGCRVAGTAITSRAAVRDARDVGRRSPSSAVAAAARTQAAPMPTARWYP